MSDRHHEPPEAAHPFEVRLAEPASAGTTPWRSVAFTVEYEDAARVATALVATGGDGSVFAEVWGPAPDKRAHCGVLARFPTPSREEQQEMWIEAAGEHYSGAYSDLKH